MKKLDIFKTIQLIFFILLTGFCIYMTILNPEVYHYISTNASFRLICGLLWGVLGISFLFLFLDFSFFSSFKRDYRELDNAVRSDPVAGIPNRYSCDAVIEKYLDKPLPENLGCVMFDLTNIFEINKAHGHAEGNALIKDFSNILRMTSVDLCFVGRNGGNKFMALFEDGSQHKIDTFLARVSQKVTLHNGDTQKFPIVYKYGTAFCENEDKDIHTITDLIALANKRIYEQE